MSRSAYLRVFKLWSEEELPGEMQAIMMTLAMLYLFTKESRRIRVNLEALNGTWSAFSSMALIHYFKARRLLINKSSTFYWFTLLPDVFVCCCFACPVLFNSRLSQLEPVYPHFNHYPFLLELDRLHEILKKYHWLLLHVLFDSDCLAPLSLKVISKMQLLSKSTQVSE